MTKSSQTDIDVCFLYKFHQIARLVSHLINYFSKLMFTAWQENATKFDTKNEIYKFIYIIKWLLMAIL